jgi:hypothetical protein
VFGDADVSLHIEIGEPGMRSGSSADHGVLSFYSKPELQPQSTGRNWNDLLMRHPDA